MSAGRLGVCLAALQVAVFVMVFMAPAEALPVQVEVAVVEEVAPGRQLLASVEEGVGGCAGVKECNSKAKKLTHDATDLAAKYKKCDEINAKLAKQMAANAKLEAAMRGRLAKANAKLKELAAARKIRMEKLAKYEAKDRAKEMKTKALLATVPGAKANLKKKPALSAAATKKAKKLADIAHKIAADPKNLKKMGKISAASAKAASAHSKMFVAEIEVSKAKAHMKNALKIAGKGKGSRAAEKAVVAKAVKANKEALAKEVAANKKVVAEKSKAADIKAEGAKKLVATAKAVSAKAAAAEKKAEGAAKKAEEPKVKPETAAKKAEVAKDAKE